MQRYLFILGTGLFLLGLVSGLLTGLMANPRMGLSAHMQGLTNGMFLIALGAAWPHVTLGHTLERLAFWLLAFGTVANWVATSLAAMWNTGMLTPIMSAQPAAAGWQEVIVSGLLLLLSGAMLAGTGLVLAGFVRRR